MHVARAVHALQSFASSGLFSHQRYISPVLWLWLSCLIWEGSLLCLKHTCSDQMCDWNSINRPRECLSPLVCRIRRDQKGAVYRFCSGREQRGGGGVLQMQSERSIRSRDLKFPSFIVTQPQQGWLGVVEVGMIRYSYDLMSCIFPQQVLHREINLSWSMTTSQRFLHHFSLHCSDCEGTIKYAQVCPALKKKKMFHYFHL